MQHEIDESVRLISRVSGFFLRGLGSPPLLGRNLGR